MAISVQIYSNANASTKTITFEFVGDILAPDDVPANAACQSFYFKITAGATQDNNATYPVKIVRSLGDLALFKPGDATVARHQTALNSGTTNSYGTIREMIVDYVWDYINGHAANEYGSQCTLQRPMKF